MNTCNDPKCPLNRQGVPHEIHELIESRIVKNPCKDGRCAMNRMGIPHDSHDELISEKKNTRGSSGHKQDVSKEYEPESYEDALEQIGKNVAGSYKINKLTREQLEAERQRRQRISIEEEQAEQNRDQSHTILEKTTPTKPKPKSGLFSRFSSKSNIPSANQILQTHDPYQIFGLKPDTTCQEIELQYRELSQTYDAARGIIHKSIEEKVRANAIQSRINVAHDKLIDLHHCD